MHRAVSILLLLTFAVTGSGAVAALHRTQHQHDDEPSQAESPRQHEHHCDCDPPEHVERNTDGTHHHLSQRHEHCQTCLDLHLRVLTATAPEWLPIGAACRATVERPLPQVLTDLTPLCIDTTGPPAA